MMRDSAKLQLPKVNDKVKLVNGRVFIVHAIQYEITDCRKKIKYVVIEEQGGVSDGKRELVRYSEWLQMICQSTILRRDKSTYRRKKKG